MILEAVSHQARNDWNMLLSQVQWLDVLLLITFVLGVFLGLKKGLSKVIPGLIEVVLSQAIAVEYYKPLADFVGTWVPVPAWILKTCVFVLLVVAVIVISRFVSQIISLVATIEFKPIASNVGGAIAGGLQFVLFLSLICYFLNLFPIPYIQDMFKDRSLSGSYLAKASEKVNRTFTHWLPKPFPEKPAENAPKAK